MKDPRRLALRVLGELFDRGRSFGETLDAAALTTLEPRDRSLCRALCFGVARHRLLLDHLIDGLLERPLKAKQRELRRVLQLGIFQLGWLDLPAHAAVSTMVRLPRQRWERGLVNAVLRRYDRERPAPDFGELPASVRWSLPNWFVEEVEVDWPRHAAAIFTAGNEPGPLWLRVDLSRSGRDTWLERLHAAGIEGEAGPGAASVRLAEARDVAALPGFDEGLVSVQDAAAQFAAELVPMVGDGRILDACAAPGGKTLHLAALQPDSRILALDIAEARLGRLRDNLERAGARVEVRCADAADAAALDDGEPFAAILVDAPCSGTGVLRRHPDGKWLKRADDLPGLTTTQDRILDAAWQVLAPGGTLVYATCSILRDENDRRFAAFLARHDSAEAIPVSLPVGRASGSGWQVLPGESGLDGFFYARCRKP
ncbi:MAG: 16S rRNA (cytosine(967)-C(5))-methyltransferase RsmB [Pseudomonadota bacterium]